MWSRDGLPRTPGAWIATTARNRAVDRLRRESRGRALLQQLALEPTEHATPQEVGPVDDDRLRLVFTCCHPALSTPAQVALTLRLLGGLSTEQVAAAFLVPEPTMAQRLVRAKRKIALARIPYRVPAAHELSGRLRPVLAVVYLIYTAGADAGPGERGDDLCTEAIRLARLLGALMSDEREVTGLLALLLLTESRRPARVAADGSFVPLGEQDRSRWDRALADEGLALVRRCLRDGEPGAYQLQAAIGAVHTQAGRGTTTDWRQVVVLYDRLLAVAPTPVVALNRAVAVGEVAGPAAALALVDGLDLTGYQAFHAVRADLLRRLDRLADAAGEYARAAGLAREEPQRAYLRARAAAAAAAPDEPVASPTMALQDLLDGTDGPARSVLASIRSIALDVAPEAVEGVRYGVPVLLYRDQPLLGLAVTRKGLSLYPFSPAALDAFRDRLGSAAAKGTVRFTASDPVPDDVVRDLVSRRRDEIDAAAG